MRRQLPQNRIPIVVLVTATFLAFAIFLFCNSSNSTSAFSPSRDPALRHAIAITHFQTGNHLLNTNQTSAAIREWETAIGLDPSFPEPYLAEAAVYETSGNYPLALARIQALARAAPTTPHLLCREADIYFRAGRLSRSLQRAREAIRTEPTCALANHVIGAIFSAIGEDYLAAEHLEAAYHNAPRSEGIALTLAQALARIGRKREALRLALSVALDTPRHPVQAYFVAGRLLEEYAGDSRSAYRFLAQARIQAPADPAIQRELGIVLAHLGRFRAAYPLLKRSHANRDSRAAYMLARTCAALRLPEAKQQRELAAAVRSQELALRQVRRSHFRRPYDRMLALRLARLELAAGHRAETLDLLRDILRTDPNNPTAIHLLWEVLPPPHA